MDHMFITQMIGKLQTGRDSVCHMRDLFKQKNHDDQEYHKGVDDHSMVALNALDSVLSMLHTSEHLSLQDEQIGGSKSQDSAPQTPKRDRRGCYKRRRNVESKVMDTTTLADDGRAWRKYGQKVILNSAYPRNYYRCTHKTDQGCQATKQVQQISDKPTKYRIIYHGHHTCKSNLLKTPSLFIDPTVPIPSDSSVYVSFDTNTSTPSPKQGISSFFFSNSAVKQEHGPIKAETTSEPSDAHHHQQYNLSPSSPDPAITTPRSEISSDVYSSVASPHDVDMDMGEEYLYYRQMMATDHESVNLDQVFESLHYDHHYGS